MEKTREPKCREANVWLILSALCDMIAKNNKGEKL